MKSQFMLTCLLSSAFFTLQTRDAVAAMATSVEIEEHVLDKEENLWRCFCGSARSKDSAETDFTVLHLKNPYSSEDQISNLAGGILSAYPDIVCVREIRIMDASDIYDALQSDYAHFLYLDTTHSPEHCHFGNLLIASKYPIEGMQFSNLEPQFDYLDEEHFLFLIKNGSKPLGHICIPNLKGNSDALFLDL